MPSVRRTIFTISLLIFCFVPLGLAQSTYTFTDLHNLAFGTYSDGRGINNFGEVIGCASVNNDVDEVAFTYNDGLVHELSLPFGGGAVTGPGSVWGSCGGAVNDAGDTVYDYILTVTDPITQAVTYQLRNSHRAPLGYTFDYVTGINNHGVVTGFFDIYDGSIHAFGPGGDTGTLGGQNSWGFAINNNGDVTGCAQTSTGEIHPFLYSNGIMQDLGTLGPTGNYGCGLGINDSGQVTGLAAVTPDFHKAFLYSADTGMVDIGASSGSVGYAINASGQVVGHVDSGTIHYPFLYDTGSIVDLSAALPAGYGYYVSQCVGGFGFCLPEVRLSINNRGQIAGAATTNLETHAFLLSPINTPTGSNVIVTPIDPSTATSPVTLTFNSVTQDGFTTLKETSSCPSTPSGFQLGQPPVCFLLDTTAVYTAPITICINYAGISFTGPNNIVIGHYDSVALSWTQLTTTIDTATTTACASTPSLSPFALFEPVSDFSIAAGPASVSVQQGSSGSSSILTAVTSGSAQTVSLTVSGVPSGATASLSPTSVTAGGSSTLSINAGTAAAGVYPLTVTGVEGSMTHATSVTLTVTQPPNDFSIAASPASVSVQQGSSGSSSILTAVTSGSAQTVSLTVSGVPSGASASLSPTSVTAGGSSTLTVSTTAATPAGVYTLTVTGTEGSMTHATSVTLTVTSQQVGVSVTPAGINFGVVKQFSLLSRNVTVKNMGTGTVSISKVSVTAGVGTDLDDFTSISLCGSSLAPGKSCTIVVVFFADNLGTLSATLYITDNAAGSPQAITLTGTATK